jgi:threonine dehydrogenase-like Zn-dependent dehydrogenase
MPGEPLGCALNIFSRADIRPGQRVAVLGCGFLGALLIQLVEQSGAEVVAISRRPWSLELARRCGAHHAYPLTDPQGTLGLLEEALGGSLCERVIEATGKQIGLDIATQLVAERGKLIIAGYHQDGARSVNMQLWNWRGIDVINAHERDQQVYMSGIRAAIKAVEQGRLEITSLLTHRFELDDLGQALQLAGERPEGFLKSYIAVA